MLFRSENKWVRADRDARKRSARMDIKVLRHVRWGAEGTFYIFIPSRNLGESVRDAGIISSTIKL